MAPPPDSSSSLGQKVCQITSQVKNNSINKDVTTSIVKCQGKLPEKITTIYVALTIDDGPRRNVTPQFIDYLKKKKIPATWYIVKQNVDEWGKEEYYKIAKELVDAGHEIAIVID